MARPPPPVDPLLTINRKALTINLDGGCYGTIAEIGAGQGVARIFFQVGGASGAIAKTISAYDMTFSDAIYGKAPRYVSRARLAAMLDHEYELLEQRLRDKRGETTRFFVFADTVAALNFQGTNECHGWMGVRFQDQPGAVPSEIMIHVRMRDRENLLQQEAIGAVGVNLIHAAFHYRDDLPRFVCSLADHVGSDRVEVDMLCVAGPAFQGVDNRLLSLQLVQFGLTHAVMFGPDGAVLQPSEVLYKQAVLVERGSFRPVTRVNVDMLNCAAAQFLQEPQLGGREHVVLMEITMNNLLATGELDAADFLSRVDMLGHAGFTTLISNYSEFYRLVAYLRRYTREMIGVVLGINNLFEIFDEKYYDNLEGGILESMGRMFQHAVRLYVYPMREGAYRRYMTRDASSSGRSSHAFASEMLVTATNFQPADHLRNLYAHLLQNRNVNPVMGFDPDCLDINSRDALRFLREHDPRWETMVPATVAHIIKQRGLFGYNARTVSVAA